MKKKFIILSFIIFIFCFVNIDFASETAFSDLAVFEDLYLVSEGEYDDLNGKNLTYEDAIIFLYDVLMDDDVNLTSATSNYDEAYKHLIEKRIILKEISNKDDLITEYDYYKYIVRVLGYAMDEERTHLEPLAKNIYLIDLDYTINKEPIKFEKSLKIIIKMFSKNMKTGENSFDYYLKSYTDEDMKYLRSYQVHIAENDKYILNSLDIYKRYINKKGSSKHRVIDAGEYNKELGTFDTLQLTDKFLYISGTTPTNRYGSQVRVDLETSEYEEISFDINSLLYPYGRYAYYHSGEKDDESDYSMYGIYRINLLTKKKERLPIPKGRIHQLYITKGKLYFVEWYSKEFLPGKKRDFNKLQSVDLNDYSLETLEDCSMVRVHVGLEKIYYTKAVEEYTTYTGTKDTTSVNEITFLEYDPITKEKRIIRTKSTLYRNYDVIKTEGVYEVIRLIGIDDKYMYTYRYNFEEDAELSNIFERMNLETFEIVELKSNFKGSEIVREGFLVEGYMALEHDYGGMGKYELYKIHDDRIERIWSNKN